MFNATIQILVRPTGDVTVYSHHMTVPASLALSVVESDQPTAENAQVHQTIDRDGHGIRVFYTRLAVAHRGADDITHIVTIPTAALTEESR
ncbi:hypothetical protein ACFVZH_24780 [Streptomyces sp. NPDC059534]|uniref:hypothetical protein n=1 Tax=Streptomyces sp. NPDC059534 TaxID=3346859 RepID=UPI0036AD184F